MENVWNNQGLIDVLKNNGVVVMPTDTLYGIVGSALDRDVVQKIYALRKRQPTKPCIVLIADEEDLQKFSITLSEEQKNEIRKHWPGPISIILDCAEDAFEYLHRGTKTLAFRVPVSEGLRDLLKKAGPLVAPSANTEGLPPAKDTDEARNYFGDGVDFYLDGGVVSGSPSRVIRLEKDGSVAVLRG